MPLKRAVKFLKNVVEHKEIVPFRRYCGGIGRHAQVGFTNQFNFCKRADREFFA